MLSPQTALAHYTQVTEEHYRKVVQNPVQQFAATARTDSQEEEGERPESEELRDLAICRNSLPEKMMTPTGFEPVSRP